MDAQRSASMPFACQHVPLNVHPLHSQLHPSHVCDGPSFQEQPWARISHDGRSRKVPDDPSRAHGTARPQSPHEWSRAAWPLSTQSDAVLLSRALQLHGVSNRRHFGTFSRPDHAQFSVPGAALHEDSVAKLSQATQAPLLSHTPLAEAGARPPPAGCALITSHTYPSRSGHHVGQGPPSTGHVHAPLLGWYGDPYQPSESIAPDPFGSTEPVSPPQDSAGAGSSMSRRSGRRRVVAWLGKGASGQGRKGGKEEMVVEAFVS